MYNKSLYQTGKPVGEVSRYVSKGKSWNILMRTLFTF